MKILLINSAHPNDPLKKNHPFMPLALPLLAGAAPENDYEFIDMLSGDKINFNRKYDLVGISMRITAEQTVKAIAEEFRRKNIKVIVGGPQASCLPFKTIEYADSVVIGEAEELWALILNDFNKNKLKKFYVCSPKKFDPKGFSVHQIFSYPDLKKIQPAKRDLYKRKYGFDTLFASRGCPIDCDFCSVPKIFGGKIRTRLIDDVVNEIDTFNNFFYLLDDSVFGRPDNYDYYVKLYEKISNLKKKRFWTGQANLDAAATKKGQEVIKKASESGLLYAAVGMESINPVILKKSGIIKKTGAKNEKDVIKKMKEYIGFIQHQGIIISGWFTIGYEEDEIDTFYKTLEFCEESNIIPVISVLEALPGTRLYNRLEKEKRLSNEKRINIIHPGMNDPDIFKTLKRIVDRGYSLKSMIKKTMFYSKKFEANNTNINNKIFNKIYKTIFTFILQTKLKKGIIGYSNDEIVG